LFAVAYRAATRMVESRDRTSTRSVSATASGAIGSGGVLTEAAAGAGYGGGGFWWHATSRQAAVRTGRANMLAQYSKSFGNMVLQRATIPPLAPAWYLCNSDSSHQPGEICLRADSFLRLVSPMIRQMQEKLGREIDQLSHELNILLPQAIAQAVELGDLRENSEYKAALERQQFVQARLGQLHQRLNQLSQLANTEAPTDKVGLGSRVTVLDLETNDTDTYVVVLAEMIDIDADHISLASPLGRALGGRKVGEEVTLRLPTATRSLRILDLVTIHQSEAAGEGNGETGKATKEKRKVGKANGKR
jgi:transcription elongation factor GreA